MSTQASLRVSLRFPHWLGNSPRWSQTYHNRSHSAPVPVIRGPSYSDGLPECPPRVWFSPDIDTSKFTLRLLSHTPGGSQRLNYILLMQSSRMWALCQIFPDWFGRHRSQRDRLKKCWWLSMQLKRGGIREWRKSKTECDNVSSASLCTSPWVLDRDILGVNSTQ